MIPRFALIVILLTSALSVAQPVPSQPAEGTAQIEDNSFLVEEAFNQERNVIQHISSFTRLWDSKDWAYTFTQEWPFPGHEKHQLSYTLVMTSPGAFPESGAGFGDTALNYRYQLIGGGGKQFSFSPRVSVLLPTGNS